MAPGIGPQRIAVIVPCTDRAETVGGVVDALHAALPSAVVHVYDGASTDATAEVAARHGAVVRREPARGRDAAVRRAFADVDADVYVLVDGDVDGDGGAHDASDAGRLVDVLLSGPHDHVVAVRSPSPTRGLDRAVGSAVGAPTTDALSGYRVVSRRFAASFSAPSRGLPVEVELAAHAAHLRVASVHVPVGGAVGGGAPTAATGTGARALAGLPRLAVEERPLGACALSAAAVAAAALLLGAPLVALAGAALLLAVGVVLGAVRRGGRDAARRAYLALPAPGVRAVELLDPDGPEDLTDLVELVELGGPGVRAPRPRTPSDAR